MVVRSWSGVSQRGCNRASCVAVPNKSRHAFAACMMACRANQVGVRALPNEHFTVYARINAHGNGKCSTGQKLHPCFVMGPRAAAPCTSSRPLGAAARSVFAHALHKLAGLYQHVTVSAAANASRRASNPSLCLACHCLPPA